MANLSNINNKFLFTDGDFLKIGNLAPINNISGTESGISITNGNCASITLDNSAAQGKTFSIYSAVNGSLNFYDVDANSGRLVIDTSGNVGISETDPSGYWGQANNIVIDTSGNGGITIKSTSAGNGRLVFTDTKSSTAGNTDGGMITYNHTDNEMRFQTNGSQRMVIISGGSVGIGTESPSAKLEVRGTAPTYTNSSTVFWGGTTNSDVHNGIMLSSYGNALGGSLASNLHYSNSNTPTQTNVSRSSGQISFVNTTVASKTSYINFGGYYKGTTTFVERMCINNDGNVGIGTTNPQAKLQIDCPGLSEFAGPNSSNAGASHITLSDVGSGNRDLMSGPSIVFKTPVLSDGTSLWATSRLLGSPSSAGSARGTFSIQVRDNYDPFNDGTSWNWRTCLTAINTGKIGIGTTSPKKTLDIAASTPTLRLTNTQDPLGNGTVGTIEFFTNDSSTGATRAVSSIVCDNQAGSSVPGGQLVFKTSLGGGGSPVATEKMRIDSNGYVTIKNNAGVDSASLTFSNSDTGIGINQSIGYLNFYSNDGSTSSLGGVGGISVKSEEAFNTSFTPTYMSFYTHQRTNNNGTSLGNVTERMRIASDGDVLVGITDTASEPTNNNFTIINPASNASITVGGHSGTHTAVKFRHNGSTTPGTIVITTNTTTYNTSSDYRLKEDLQDFTGLDMVSKIPVYDFKWKTDESRSYGVMAHELQEVLPDAVVGEKDAQEMQGVDYSKIVPLLVKSIQELKADNDSLKARIETLENN
jgi:hypothetical protein